MQLKRDQLSPTKVKLTITADPKTLENVKAHVLNELGANVKVQGFRPGTAPAALIEKQLDPNVLQGEFMEHAVNQAYGGAIENEKLRPVAQPQIEITKFVPFNTLEFTAEVEVVGSITLPDYKKIKLTAEKPSVTADDVNAVIKDLRVRASERKEVTRAAKAGDEVVIDFKGVDAKTKEPINGADGQGYPLILGSNSFIPGFEDEVIGLEPGKEKTFTLTFPKDYGVAALQNRKVSFTVTAQKVEELVEAKLDDEFAAKVGPFKTLADLKADIKDQLMSEKQRQVKANFENELLDKIAKGVKVALPDTLVNDEIDRMEDEERRNLVYRGQTWEEHLTEEGVTAEEHREQKRPVAEQRLITGLSLGEIAEKEGVNVTPEELEIRIQILKGQYTDNAMRAELDKPENRRDIANRLLTEKTLAILTDYVAKASK
jgi:trigger factor